MLTLIVVLIVKKVSWSSEETEVTSGFRGKGRVHRGGHLLNESNFDWPRMGAS